MSRDIYVQDLPAALTSVDDIPDEWSPQPLPFDAARVRGVILDLAPDADFSDPSWGRVSLPGADIEVNVGADVPLESFALHVRASDAERADDFVASLLERLNARALDPEGAPETGIFGNG